MAKITYLALPEGYSLSNISGLCAGDRFVVSRLRRSVYFTSRRRKAGLNARTMLPIISEAWKNLTLEEQAVWSDVGEYQNLTGWRFFVKDKSLRIKNDLAGDIVPNNIYQSLVGQLHVQAPASGMLITQLHPQAYWVLRKVRATKSQYEPVAIVEDFALPLQIKISYKSDLQSAGSSPSVKFYAIVYSLYQGRKIETLLTIDLPLVHDWERLTASLSSVLGYAKDYALFIELVDVVGDLFVDNIEAVHSAQNWCRDPFCNDINQSFTRAFYQIPKHWVALDLPSGASFESVYYN